MGGIDWNKLTSLDGLDHLHVLLAGTLPPNPTELLLSEEFRQLIEKLRPNYDFIIVDTPPVLPVADAGIIGTVTDGCILVYQSDKTSRHLFLRAIQMLQKNRIKILGVVINQLAFDIIIKSSRYGYNYYYSSSPENKKQL
jgi:receptor protein-tyrosine kinase